MCSQISRVVSSVTGIILLLASLVLPAIAANEDLAARKNLYDCQQAAAEYTYNLDKAGDQELFDKHVAECLEAKTIRPAVKLAAKSDNCHPMSFVNNSGEDIYLGVWMGKLAKGVPPPANFPDWKLPAGATRSWCAPLGFNGRFVARTGCNDKNKCDTGDCCRDDDGSSSCANKICTTGNQPASLAEFTMDDDNGQTWYNVSYVDGYNFPVQVTINTTTESTCIKTVGCSTLPSCPLGGGFVDGVCLAPYKMYEIQHPAFMKEQQYYILAAKCASSDPNTCGCGNQCAKDNKTACPNSYPPNGDIKSAGCSPLALNKGDYADDELAKAQVVCVDNAAGCKFLWDNDSKVYVNTIKPVCPGAYTWQYDDAGSLGNCKSSEITGFTVTFSKRPAGTNASTMTLAPDQSKPFSGTIKVGNNDAIPFTTEKIKFKVSDKDTVVIKDNCGSGAAIRRTCQMTYDASFGLIPVGTKYNSATKQFEDDGSGTAVKDCYQAYFCGYAWDGKNLRKYLGMGVPSTEACKGESGGTFTIYPNNDTSGSYQVGSGKAISYNTGGTPIKINIKDGDKLTLKTKCMPIKSGDADSYMTCTMLYDKDSGLQKPNDDSCSVPSISSIAWGNSNKSEFHFGNPSATNAANSKNPCK